MAQFAEEGQGGIILHPREQRHGGGGQRGNDSMGSRAIGPDFCLQVQEILLLPNPNPFFSHGPWEYVIASQTEMGIADCVIKWSLSGLQSRDARLSFPP